jgi:hypothetical protein
LVKCVMSSQSQKIFSLHQTAIDPAVCDQIRRYAAHQIASNRRYPAIPMPFLGNVFP